MNQSKSFAKNILLTFLLFFIIQSGKLYPQNLYYKQSFPDNSTSSENLFLTFYNDALITIDDFLSFYTEPLRFTSEEWLYTAGLTGTILLMFTVDQKITNSFSRNTINTINNDFWDVPTFYGTIPFSAALSSSIYFAGLFTGNKNIRNTGRLMGEALLISGSAVFVLRFLTGRERPYHNNGAWKFHGFKVNREYQSFPSGHTNLAFALSTVLAERIDNFWAKAGLYGLASLTAVAQVINNQHFLSDVIIGALFGYGAGMYVIGKENDSSGSKNKSSFILSPSYNGVALILIF